MARFNIKRNVYRWWYSLPKTIKIAIIVILCGLFFSCGSRKVEKQSHLDINKESFKSDLKNDIYLDSVILNIVSKYVKNISETSDSIVITKDKIVKYNNKIDLKETKETKTDSLAVIKVDKSKKSTIFEKKNKKELTTKNSDRNNTVFSIAFVFIIVFFILLGFKFVKRGS